MKKYTFEEIKRYIFEWSQGDILKYMAENDKVELSKNDDVTLILDFTFDNCLAQLSVSEPFFAPYRFVFFEAMDLYSEKSELIYFFYDTNDMTKETIINELKIAIQYCSCYTAGYPIKKYFKKKGVLNIKQKDLYHIVHPDDIKKVNIESIKGEFICKGVNAQYLVVENNLCSLKVLPECFMPVE